MNALSALLRGETERHFARAVSITLATRVVGILAGVVTLTLTTRLLGAEGRGQFAVAMGALALVLQCSNFGLHASAIYHLSREPALRRQVTAVLVAFSLGGVALVAGTVYAAAWLRPALFPGIPLSLLGLAFLTAPAAMFALLAGSALLGLGAPAWFNGLDLSARLIGLVAVGCLLWWSLPAFFVAYGVLHYVVAGVAYGRLAGPAGPARPDLGLARLILGYGLRAFLASVSMFFVLRSDLFLVNALVGTAEAGRYSVATQVGEVLSLAAASIAAMLFPRLSAMAPARRLASTWQVTRVTALLLGVGAVGLAAVSPSVFLAWFGSEFAGASVALWWLLPGLWCLGVNTILYQYLAATGMPWFVVGATLLGAVANVLLNLYLIPAFGIAGAGAASSVTYAFLLLLTVGYLRVLPATAFPGGD